MLITFVQANHSQNLFIWGWYFPSYMSVICYLPFSRGIVFPRHDFLSMTLPSCDSWVVIISSKTSFKLQRNIVSLVMDIHEVLHNWRNLWMLAFWMKFASLRVDTTWDLKPCYRRMKKENTRTLTKETFVVNLWTCFEYSNTVRLHAAHHLKLNVKLNDTFEKWSLISVHKNSCW